MLSFDLGALSLDLDPAAIQPAATPVEADTDSLDPLSTKLALAKEFQSIGDNDGAHALAEEVYTLATGQLRADAKRFLSELGFAQSGFSPSTL
jgi:pilus assembly protein FimV